MIDHIGISVTDFAAAERFYTAVLKPIGGSLLAMIPEDFSDGVKVGGFGQDRATFWLSEGAAQSPPIHIAFAAPTRAQVDAFYYAAIVAGGTDNGEPGLRPNYHANYYGAFVLDPDGNNVEMVCHAPV
jgi:catechol 2,3-dioxygenase-like lactoylglutathione lyase family enzyme